eukprot:m.334494 g.334494  ORF g.334494 m.334494 type:complete len:565 (+) comp20507_c1_seq2:254-1948(+)
MASFPCRLRKVRILVLTFTAFFAANNAAADPPHIIHILADDLGWADVGFHRDPAADPRDVQTPNIDALVQDGIELSRFYVFKYCSPSRSSIQSGRNPIHVNVQNVLPEVSNPRDPIGGFQGIPTNMTGIAAVLRRGHIKYRTHIVGKWDVGMATELHHPRARGYESWLGYWHHSNDYWTHTVDHCGTDNTLVRDLWLYNATYDGPAPAEYRNGPSCSQNNQTPQGERCIYEEALFTTRVLDLVNFHNVSEPLFLFWAMHLVHMPLQVPMEYIEKFSFIDDSYRRLNHAMGNYMDSDIGRVVAALKARQMWENSLVVFHSDNGGEIMGAGICGGNNWPLTGGKFSNWEGGIRVNAFVTGGFIPTARRGTQEQGFITGWDWYSTYATVAGVDPADDMAKVAGLPPIDSINMLPLLLGTNMTPPRTDILLGDTSALSPNADGKSLVGGVISGAYKLVLGADNQLRSVDQYVRTGPSWPNSTSHLVPLAHPKKCARTPATGCLFNIFTDPTEQNNIAGVEPSVFKALLAKVDAAQQTVYSPVRGTKDARACNDVYTLYNGSWGPFVFP